jgi:hypothetical protein
LYNAPVAIVIIMERRSMYNAPVAIAPIIVFHNNGKFSTGLWKSQTVSGVVWYNGDKNAGIFVSFALFQV